MNVSLELSFVPSEIANEKVFSRELSGKTKENHLREYFGKPVAAGTSSIVLRKAQRNRIGGLANIRGEVMEDLGRQDKAALIFIFDLFNYFKRLKYCYGSPHGQSVVNRLPVAHSCRHGRTIQIWIERTRFLSLGNTLRRSINCFFGLFSISPVAKRCQTNPSPLISHKALIHR